MATSTTLEQFARRMEARAREVIAASEDVVRRAALIADQVVVLATPVDTGRARANWVTSIGSPVFRDDPTPGSSGAAGKAIAQGQRVIATWKIGAGPIFISNSVPYIDALDNGHSAQAPDGMTAQAISAASSYLRSGRVRLLRS